jgi:hypothetical protein
MRKWAGRCIQGISRDESGAVVNFRIPEEMKVSWILQPGLCVI